MTAAFWSSGLILQFNLPLPPPDDLGRYRENKLWELGRVDVELRDKQQFPRPRTVGIV